MNEYYEDYLSEDDGTLMGQKMYLCAEYYEIDNLEPEDEGHVCDIIDAKEEIRQEIAKIDRLFCFEEN